MLDKSYEMRINSSLYLKQSLNAVTHLYK